MKELGRTGVLIPEVGMGTWNYHAGPGPLRRGLEAGALFIDTAESYGTEPVVGEAVRGLRDRVFVATKVSPRNFQGAALKQAADASLRRLGIDVIDLLQLHEPNPAVPIEETMGAMAELVDAGKVRFIGVSNFSLAELEQAQKALGRHRIASNQVRYSVIDRTIESGLLQYCQANQVTVIAYSPLARDFSRIRDCDPGGIIDQVVRMTGRSAAQVVLNWCLSKAGVVVIPKANSEEHILDNCSASSWRLSGEQIALLDGLEYRRRGRLDVALRRWTPRALRPFALRAAGLLPRGLRRRLS